MSGTDARSEATRRAVVGALSEMVLHRRYDDIRAADVIERAGVGRSTFYEHFRNKDGVLRAAVAPLLGLLAGGLIGEAEGALERTLEHFAGNRDKALGLLRGEAGGLVGAVLAEELEKKGVAPVPAQFVAEGALGVVRSWLGGERAGGAGPLADELSAMAQPIRRG